MTQPPRSTQAAPAPSSAAVGAKAPKPKPITPSMKAISPKDFGYEQARHLLWRAGFGGTPRQIQTLASWGPDKAVDYILNFDGVGYESPRGDLFDRDIMHPPTEEERRAYRMAQQNQDEDAVAKFRQMRQERERADRSQIGEVQKWWIKRMIETPRPLEEKMTLFWHGHFATNYRTIENSYHMFLQNQMFRTHAVGNFGSLLFALIRDPAMIAYLDNNDSRKGKPNENLAREIMELFALGIGNYSEQDIKEGARCLTGYTFNDDEFVFQKNNHDDGTKQVLGRQGKIDGDGFVKIILEQRACSTFIARKLYSFFVRTMPPVERLPDADLDKSTGTVIRTLASTMLNAKYELKPVLRQLFLSEHFYDERVVGDQIKSPTELIVGAVRSLNAPARDISILEDALDRMGQKLMYPPSVKGWEGGRAWVNTSTMFVRQNVMTYLLTGKKPVGYDSTADTQPFDPMPLLAELEKADPKAAQDPGRVADYLLRLTLGRIPTHSRDTLLQFAGQRGVISKETVTGLLLLITALPEYQLC